MPETPAELVEYFLDTEAREIEFEISRIRPRSVTCSIYSNLLVFQAVIRDFSLTLVSIEKKCSFYA